MVVKNEVKLEPFHITQADGNVIAAAAVANIWSDVWKYQVPQGTGIVIQSGDTLSAYLADSAGEVGRYNCYVKVEVRDPSEQDKEIAFGPALYNRIREFQDRATMARLGVSAPVKVYPRQWIVIVVKDDAAGVIANCYFDLFTSKAAAPIGA